MMSKNRLIGRAGSMLFGWRHLSTQRIGQASYLTHPHLLKKGEVTPGTPLHEYERRRNELMHSLPSNSLAVIVGHSLAIMSEDIPYPFRQSSNLSYLCGFQEPDTVLCLKSDDNGNCETFMAVPPRDIRSELWNGPRSGVDGAQTHFGAKEAYPTNQLSNLIFTLSKSRPNVFCDGVGPMRDTVERDVALAGCQPIADLKPFIHRMRIRKTNHEVAIMRKAANISSAAFVQAMRQTAPGQSEHELHNVIEYSARQKGAKRLAYPPVVAGGANGLTLHYIANDMLLRDGDTVLVDAGAELDDYAADISRTWPVSGSFTEAQKLVYNAVLQCNKDCISVCQANGQISLNRLLQLAVALLSTNLSSIGLIPPHSPEGEAQKLVKRWFPHHIGHYLGMDTHDTLDLSTSLALRPGMVITIEPGLYLPLDDPLVPERFRGIAVRIEDNVHITENGPEVFTAACPKEIDDVEAVVGQSLA